MKIFKMSDSVIRNPTEENLNRGKIREKFGIKPQEKMINIINDIIYPLQAQLEIIVCENHNSLFKMLRIS